MASNTKTAPTEANVEVVGDIDPGDKISASLSFKKNLGNYQSMDFYAGVSITKREGEPDESAWKRAWAIVENQLDAQVGRAEGFLEADK